MTYCVGLKVNEGLVLLSDTRTNAGFDNISTYKKTYIFERPGKAVVTILAAGSLSVTQTVLAKIAEQVDDVVGVGSSILECNSMLQVVEHIGDILSNTSADIHEKMTRMSDKITASASFIVAGQIKGGELRMYLVYPEGNFIEATADTPFLQIGEHKYGKPILDRVVEPEISLDDARKAALLSMDSTLRSNLSVGMPLDLTLIRKGECKVHQSVRIEDGDEDFTEMSRAWSQVLRQGFSSMNI